MKEASCGDVLAYRRGCRCGPCKDANAAVSRAFRAGSRQDRMVNNGRNRAVIDIADCTLGRDEAMRDRGYRKVNGRWVP